MIVDVLVAVKTKGENDIFSYSVPKELTGDIKVGSIVEVPFGKRKERGAVVQVKSERLKVTCPQTLRVKRCRRESASYNLKSIHSISKFLIPHSYLPIIDWVANYYLCTRGEALGLFLPPDLSRPREAVSSIRHRVLGIKKLNSEQHKISEQLKSQLLQANKKPALIHGVTGSGKTEIYIHLTQEALRLKKQVIILVPEIMLTPQTIERFERVFGGKICLMHSKLNKSQRMRCYDDYSNSIKPIIIGPRSALLVPSNNIGLIIVDEEQEDSYKQEQSPRYHAVDLAEKIAEANDALLVLGSATPRIESYFKAKTNEYNLYKLENRFNKLILPPSEIVDLREEAKKDNRYVISEQLQLAIAETLKAKKQVLLFLNRRGSSTFISCRDCGYIVNCPNCEIPLVHHTSSYNKMVCHHCSYRSDVPLVCPECKSIKIKFFGAGVEKVEAQIQILFPKAKIARVDASTVKSRGDIDKIYQDIKEKKYDIVLGTQMLGKGHDFPDVDLVGIISADTGLHLPYFRASEKTFRILTQVSGRSGRIHNVGKTIIQTYWPKSRAILAAAKHNFEYFYNEEIKHRKESGYPPFSKLIRIVSEDKNIDKARKEIEAMANDLRSTDIDFIGPGLCFFQRLRDRWRYHIIIKLLANTCLPARQGCQLSASSQKNQSSQTQMTLLRLQYLRHHTLTWDVDPVDLL